MYAIRSYYANATMEESLNRYGPTHINVTSVLEGIKKAVTKETKVTYVKGIDVVDEKFPESVITSYSIHYTKLYENNFNVEWPSVNDVTHP